MYLMSGGVNQPAGTGRDSDIITVMHPALDGVQTVSNGSFPPNYEDLKAIRTALNAAIDQEQLRIRDDVLFQQISVMADGSQSRYFCTTGTG
ncbi:DNA circulation family protein [Salmonella enterica subsp. indica]|uniref:DNA circulation family protein n=1 Tax=Salmonella enterica subsp. indica TaxID=59207 RepID=A0A379XTM0_SALER|nr:DNA circulation family protein [Salmonella enterica subsp. indica]